MSPDCQIQNTGLLLCVYGYTSPLVKHAWFTLRDFSWKLDMPNYLSLCPVSPYLFLPPLGNGWGLTNMHYLINSLATPFEESTVVRDYLSNCEWIAFLY